MKKRALAGLATGLLMFGMAGLANATPLYLTFQVSEVMEIRGGVAGRDYLGAQYIVKIESDESIAKSSYVGNDNVIHYLNDNSTANTLSDNFYVEGLVGNYFASSYIGSYPRLRNLGNWTAFLETPARHESTRMNLTYGVGADIVQIDAFWDKAIWPSLDSGALRSGVTWEILDDTHYANGAVEYGYFRASLVSVSASDPTAPVSFPVPEPATIILFGTGIAGLAGSRYRGKKWTS